MNTLKKILLLLCLLLLSVQLSGCSEVKAQVETIAQQIDVESVITDLLESINTEELKKIANDGYEALVQKYPALKTDNIKTFLKANGLKLMNRYVESADPELQENAGKIGEIIKILYPDLTDEVNSVIKK